MVEHLKEGHHRLLDLEGLEEGLPEETSVQQMLLRTLEVVVVAGRKQAPVSLVAPAVPAAPASSSPDTGSRRQSTKRRPHKWTLYSMSLNER